MKTASIAIAIAIALATSVLGVGCAHRDEASASQSSSITEGDEREGADQTDRVVSDPISGLLYGTYTSRTGQIARLTLKVSDPVVFVRLDRVDPTCEGDDCETRELRGVWGLAHYEGSLTKLIKFYGPDFNNLDEFAYQRDGDQLTLTYDAQGTLLEWQEPLRSPAGGWCVATDKSRACAENLACTDGICTAE